MTENGLKVFDLANELGMPSLELLKLLQSDLKLSFKNHMSQIEESDLTRIRHYLDEKKRIEEEAKKKTKKVVRRKTPAKAAGSTASTDTKVPEAAKSVRKVAAPAAPEMKGAAVPKASGTAATATKTAAATGARKILLRRKGAPAPEMPEETQSQEELSPEAGDYGAVDQQETVPGDATQTAAQAPTTQQRDGFKSATILHRPDRPMQFKRPEPRHGGGARAPQQTQIPPLELPVPGQRDGRPVRAREDTGLIDGEGTAEERAKKRVSQVQKTEEFDPSEYFKKVSRPDVHSVKRKRSALGRPARKTTLTTPKESKRVVEVHGQISVVDLAKQLHLKAKAVLKKANDQGASLESTDAMLDVDMATLIAAEFKYEVRDVGFKEDQALSEIRGVTSETSTQGHLESRPPVVTVMGHVDHGKTSLLDTIRKAKVAAGEAGGITQHIGAYTVKFKNHPITFIDTPGHAAFTQMRSRGARTTDIVILVVAANDGVMPQTIEAVNHAKAAKVPVIVAINKMDLKDAQPEKVKQQLTEHEIVSEEWGGETIFVPISAIEGTGVEQLLDAILLTAEVQGLKAAKDVPGRGTVLESRLDKASGAVVSVLVQEGTIRTGDMIVSGTFMGKIRRMVNDKGEMIAEAGPSTPVEILGLGGVPDAGDGLFVVANERAARDLIENRINAERLKGQSSGAMTLDELFAKMQEGKIKELPIIFKADVKGSLEACLESIKKLNNEKVKVKVVHQGTGGISENDIQLAMASQALIFGFNVRPDSNAMKLAEKQKIEIKTYKIIYEMFDDIQKAMKGILGTRKIEHVEGRAEVRKVISLPKVGTIAGSNVVDGKISRNSFVRLLRDSRIVFEGKVSSLKRFKDDVKEVKTGFECGIGIENYNDLKLGDIIESYTVEEIPVEMEG